MNICLTRNFKRNRTFMNKTLGTLIIGQLTISYIKFIIKTAYSSTWLTALVMSRNLNHLEVVGFGRTMFWSIALLAAGHTMLAGSTAFLLHRL